MTKAPEELGRRAKSAECLDQRVSLNSQAQQVDLNQWLFDRPGNPASASILELCAGTGNQTKRLVECVGDGQTIVALDASSEALTRLMANVPAERRDRVRTVAAKLESIDNALKEFTAPSFDWVFVAYGLYYTDDFPGTFEAILRWLKPDGRLTVVGPFGPNNGQLFDVLERGGVTLDPYVHYTSARFMTDTLLPAAGVAFEETTVRTLVNPVIWNTADDVMKYWESTTFYDPARRDAVAALVEAHVKANGTFVNEKWIMRVDATRRRAGR